jgi:phosphoglycolate phosphatase
MPLFPENISAAIFDWDGTLVYTLPLLHAAHNHVRAELGFPLWSWEEYKAHMHNSARELYPRLYGDRAEHAFTTLYSYVEANHLEKLEALQGAEALLKALQARNIPCLLVSNKSHPYLEREVEAMGWGTYFVSVCGAGIADRDKPDPAPVFWALQKAGFDNDILTDAIYIGDTGTDAKCAEALKIPFYVIGEALKEGEVATFETPEDLCRNFSMENAA